MEYDAMCFSNGKNCEEFTMEEYNVNLIWNHLAPYFRVARDCCEGYKVLVYARDEQHLKPIWLVKASLSPNFHQTEVEYYHPNTKDQNMLCTCRGWDTKKGLNWTINSAYKPVYINTNTIHCTWKPCKDCTSETMTIPQTIHKAHF